MQSIWKLLGGSSEAEAKQEVKAIKENRTKIITTRDESGFVHLKNRFSPKAQAISEVIEANSFYKVVDVNLDDYAGQLKGLRFSHQSTCPVALKLNDEQVAFNQGEYFLDISNEGNVSYELFANGNYYPIKFNEMDPEVQGFHEKYIEPLLKKKEESEDIVEVQASVGMRM